MIDTLLDIEKLLDFAIRLEELGEEFFTRWAKQAKTDGVEKFFKFLAEEESEHKKTFEILKKKTGLISNKDVQLQKDYREYFESFASTILYNEKEMEAVEDLPMAIKLAKKQETDAQLFFTDLIKYVSPEHNNIIKQIIDEEVKHFDKLVTLENKLFGT